MEPHLTTAEVAKRLGVTPSRIAQLVADKRLSPAAKAPGKRGAFLFLPEEVEREMMRRGAA